MPHFFALCSRTRSLPIVAALALGLSFSAQAKIWRIDNNGGSPGDFTSGAAAIASPLVQNGDTLYFNGSGSNYADMAITKRLAIFGPGYFLAQNPETQATPTSAYVNLIYFNAGSSGSMITGMTFGYMEINADNLLIKRNYGNRCNGGFDNGTLRVADNRSNISIVQNYLVNGCSDPALMVRGGSSNVLVKNNYLYTANGSYVARLHSACEFAQNVVNSSAGYGRIEAYSCNIYNNVFVQDTYNVGAFVGSGNGCYNNVLARASDGMFPTGAPYNNLLGQTMGNVFTLTGSSDASWMLKAGSPALAAGQNGEDCGMFGGNDPYVLSGLPTIPAIWFFSAPSSGSGASGLQIRIKAKSHN